MSLQTPSPISRDLQSSVASRFGDFLSDPDRASHPAFAGPLGSLLLSALEEGASYVYLSVRSREDQPLDPLLRSQGSMMELIEPSRPLSILPSDLLSGLKGLWSLSSPASPMPDPFENDIPSFVFFLHGPWRVGIRAQALPVAPFGFDAILHTEAFLDITAATALFEGELLEQASSEGEKFRRDISRAL